MIHDDARVLLRRLALADIFRVLRMRLAVWSVAAFLLWSLAIVTATLTDLGVAAFHAILMGAVTFLPAFLLFPVRPGAGHDAIRRIDEHSSVEAWLGYPGGPAEKALGVRAFETLSVAALERWKLPRTPRHVRLAIGGMVVVSLIVLAAAQALSLRSGYGLVFGYPEKPAAENNLITEEGRADAAAGISVPGIVVPETTDTPPEKSPQRKTGSGGRTGSPGIRDPIADPGIGPGGAQESASASRGTEAPDSSGDRAAGRAAADQLPGAEGQAVEGDENSAGASDPRGTARAPGWDGSGRALEASPIIEYRTRFERLFTDATGTETVLGDEPTAAALSRAIATYYESFDMKVFVGQPLDPALASMQDSWRHAFGNGIRP